MVLFIQVIAMAAFVAIKNRLYSIGNIIKTSYNSDRQCLTINYEGGGKEQIQGEDEVGDFLATIDQFVLQPPVRAADPPPSDPVVNTETTADGPAQTPDVEFTTDDQGEADTGEKSELEAAGIPSDLAALLHAGGVNTVDEVLAHTDLQQVEGIGKGRKEQILSILNTPETA